MSSEVQRSNLISEMVSGENTGILVKMTDCTVCSNKTHPQHHILNIRQKPQAPFPHAGLPKNLSSPTSSDVLPYETPLFKYQQLDLAQVVTVFIDMFLFFVFGILSLILCYLIVPVLKFSATLFTTKISHYSVKFFTCSLFTQLSTIVASNTSQS